MSAKKYKGRLIIAMKRVTAAPNAIDLKRIFNKNGQQEYIIKNDSHSYPDKISMTNSYIHSPIKISQYKFFLPQS